MKIDATQFDSNGAVLASPWEFRQHGQSGIPVSELFPQLATQVDDLCIIRSMKSDFPEHAQATLMLHCGYPLQGRPSLGSWLGYGLGSENSNLPGYAVVSGGMIYGGTDDYGYRATENVVTIPDLHATILHQLGLDHERLTIRHGGRDLRLTDVHGQVLRDILA